MDMTREEKIEYIIDKLRLELVEDKIRTIWTDETIDAVLKICMGK